MNIKLRDRVNMSASIDVAIASVYLKFGACCLVVFSLLITTYLWRVDYVWLEKIMLIVINPLNCVQGRRICMKRSESFSKLVKKESWDLWVLWAKEVCSSNGYPMSWDHRMTSSNGNIFRVTGPLCGEFTGRRWIPLTKASDAELWCFLWSLSE